VSLTDTLRWLCYAGAAAALLIYIVHFAGRQGWKRPWTAAGLFFTSAALAFLPSLFRDASDPGQLRDAVIVVICLLAAAALQSLGALRRRRVRADEARAAP
jgi:O-antigen ligase